MDNRINEIRNIVRALRVSMREAEAIMHEQINRDEDCTFVAEEIMKMRVVMSGLVQERTRLGDSEPILCTASLFRAGRRLAPRTCLAKAASYRTELSSNGATHARERVGGQAGGRQPEESGEKAAELTASFRNFLLQTRIGLVAGPPPMAGLKWRLRRPQPPVPRRGRFHQLGLIGQAPAERHHRKVFGLPCAHDIGPQRAFHRRQTFSRHL